MKALLHFLREFGSFIVLIFFLLFATVIYKFALYIGADFDTTLKASLWTLVIFFATLSLNAFFFRGSNVLAIMASIIFSVLMWDNVFISIANSNEEYSFLSSRLFTLFVEIGLFGVTGAYLFLRKP